MWSLNVSIPQGIVRAIEEMAPVSRGWEEIVEEPTLVIKRFEKEDLDGHIESEIKFLCLIRFKAIVLITDFCVSKI